MNFTLNLRHGPLLLNTATDESARQLYSFLTNFPTELLGHPRDVPHCFRMHLLWPPLTLNTLRSLRSQAWTFA